MVKRFGIVIALACLVAVGCRRTSPAESVSTASVKTQDAEQRVDMAALEATYRALVRDILSPYWETGQVGEAKDKLLALTVPPKYLQLHLSLVLGIDMITQGMQASDEEAIAAGKKKIDDSVRDFPWIKS